MNETVSGEAMGIVKSVYADDGNIVDLESLMNVYLLIISILIKYS
ncbi:MAG: hypothetical protein RR413_08570 [Christensenellaceae bacterium]